VRMHTRNETREPNRIPPFAGPFYMLELGILKSLALDSPSNSFCFTPICFVFTLSLDSLRCRLARAAKRANWHRFQITPARSSFVYTVRQPPVTKTRISIACVLYRLLIEQRRYVHAILRPSLCVRPVCRAGAFFGEILGDTSSANGEKSLY
jgi:hypothetical protein